MRRTVAVVVLPLLLVLAGCGSNPQEGQTAKKGSIADVTVSGSTGAVPKVSFKPPMTFANLQSKILDKGPGKGAAVTSDSEVTLNYLGINASDGSDFGSTYEKSGQPAIFTVNQVIKGFGEGIQGAHAGDRVLITVPSADGYGTTGNGGDISAGDSLIFVVELLKVQNPAKPKVLTKSEIPKLVVDKKGTPHGFTYRAGLPKKVAKLGIAVLKKGKGATITSTSSLTVNYLGQIYPAGKVFDESYTKGQPASFSLSGVIPGWQQGLVGQQAGARVVLEIPSELGYGATGSGKDIPPNADLIFVIDIVSIN
ncbi:MAG: FKBP-type peptidyl-prolyl cis-trans isomerase [Nocardioidaceae bacterium]